jgi:hypothetical protein
MATLQTIRAAAESLGFETDYQAPRLTVTLVFRIRLQVWEEGDGTKMRLRYGPYPEWLWEIIIALPLLGAGYYFTSPKHHGVRETVLMAGMLLYFLAVVAFSYLMVGRRKRQLLQRAHQLETATTPSS